MSSVQGHLGEEREPDTILMVCYGGGPYPGTTEIGVFRIDGTGYVIGRTKENAVGAKVIKKSMSYGNDPKQRWNLKDKQIFDLSNKLVLDVIDNYAVMQEPNESSLWQQWKTINDGANIVSCHDPNICLQISDEGNGEYIVIGPLLKPPARYQSWEFTDRKEGF